MTRHITRDGPLEIRIDQHQEEWSVELRGERRTPCVG